MSINMMIIMMYRMARHPDAESVMFSTTNRIANLQRTPSAVPAFVPCPAALLAGLTAEQKEEMQAIFARAWELAQPQSRPMARRGRLDFRWN